ncbi:MAG: ADP-ribosylglycohydrolase family protein [Clostridiales bacterium]|nr:ADP-ribosylglycohydrolase family protein [Clostridiales bacterium]
MIVKLNKKRIKDKIYACWLGKNIGGTMGAPYESVRHMLNISGFNSPKGEPLPNDDLDLQLVWLCAAEDLGLNNINSLTLGEYWLKAVTPHWNEYGVAKANMMSGIVPPMSGEYNNEQWKKSNGAWIRSEVWACLAPGFPDIAIKYAYSDAAVDHGVSEGTYAEMFTATLESAAFIENDIRELIEIGLSKIPPDCRIAKSVKLAEKAYDDGKTLKEAREILVEDSRDLGWFQAPCNIGFVILGLLYGEGDFKKSVISAINCGDDTDCTGATVGSIMGILKGTDGIDKELREYVGDKIITCSVALPNLSYNECPKTCTELTDRIMRLIPAAFLSNKYFNLVVPQDGLYLLEMYDFEFTDGEEEFDKRHIESLKTDIVAKRIYNRTGMAYDAHTTAIEARAEFKGSPEIMVNGEIEVKLAFYPLTHQTQNLYFKFHLPEGWTVEGPHGMILDRTAYNWDGVTVKIKAGEKVERINRITAEIWGDLHAERVYLPITVLG